MVARFFKRCNVFLVVFFGFLMVLDDANPLLDVQSDPTSVYEGHLFCLVFQMTFACIWPLAFRCKQLPLVLKVTLHSAYLLSHKNEQQ
jgi:hypothetical protein